MSVKNKIKIGDIVFHKHVKDTYGYVYEMNSSAMCGVYWFTIDKKSYHFKSQLIKVS
jgi:predicted Co/Zn/Cd cation transporter (cation efflux family)